MPWHSAASGVGKSQPLHGDPQRLKEDLIRREVASHCRAPKHSGAVFSSKIWNSIALGRGLVCAGFAGEMVNELEAAQPRAIRSASEPAEAIT